MVNQYEPFEQLNSEMFINIKLVLLDIFTCKLFIEIAIPKHLILIS